MGKRIIGCSGYRCDGSRRGDGNECSRRPRGEHPRGGGRRWRRQHARRCRWWAGAVGQRRSVRTLGRSRPFSHGRGGRDLRSRRARLGLDPSSRSSLWRGLRHSRLAGGDQVGDDCTVRLERVLCSGSCRPLGAIAWKIVGVTFRRQTRRPQQQRQRRRREQQRRNAHRDQPRLAPPQRRQRGEETKPRQHRPRDPDGREPPPARRGRGPRGTRRRARSLVHAHHAKKPAQLLRFRSWRSGAIGHHGETTADPIRCSRLAGSVAWSEEPAPFPPACACD